MKGRRRWAELCSLPLNETQSVGHENERLSDAERRATFRCSVFTEMSARRCLHNGVARRADPHQNVTVTGMQRVLCDRLDSFDCARDQTIVHMRARPWVHACIYISRNHAGTDMCIDFPISRRARHDRVQIYGLKSPTEQPLLYVYLHAPVNF